MKALSRQMNFKMMFTLLIFSLLQTAIWAQDSSSGSSTTSKSVSVTTHNDSQWYGSPWVWVVGAAVLILLLVALTRGGSNRSGSTSSDKVTVTKTVERDTDPGT